MTRTFVDSPAVRTAMPLLVGLMGPSGGGKTKSALRLAKGMQRVSGGDIFVIDTESRRALHYADEFKFRHVPFGAPFGSLDYLAAIEHCARQGAKTIIIDSMSHEHEGPGGLLEQHAAAVERMSRGDQDKAERVKMLAWDKPKAARRRMIGTILQLDVSFVFCFRAKEKLDFEKGKEPTKLGFVAITDQDFVFEMTLCCLLMPRAEGYPTWQPAKPGERMMVKLPGQFAALERDKLQLSEDVGEMLAKWSQGSAAVEPVSISELIAAYVACSDPATMRELEAKRKRAWASASKEAKELMSGAASEAARRIKASAGGTGADVLPASAPFAASTGGGAAEGPPAPSGES